MPLPTKVRAAILTCSVAAITAIGGWYGADLKISQEARRDTRKKESATGPEMLVQLEDARRGLVVKRTELEKKIAELDRKRTSVDTDVSSKLGDKG
ncbi:MAG: hypothetical protein LQ348_007082 [Seirophora lacunosa]|nr:MAG: hypothetical protein LQ348_007082 [Seirophora lacunosa]